ncbi:MAG: DNA polymerase III subunit alpha [Flammeovirgaceae bacterium]
MYLIFDTETTGLPKRFDAPVEDLDNWPRIVQIAWQLHDASGKLIEAKNHIVKPDGFVIPFNAEKVHGISTKRALAEGLDLKVVLAEFEDAINRTEVLIGHNIVGFDINVMGAEYLRMEMQSKILERDTCDTMKDTVEFVAIPGGRGKGKFKFPTLTELHQKLFGEGFGDAHDAAYDVAANARCFFGLLEQEVVATRGGIAPADIQYEAPKLEAANFQKAEAEAQAKKDRLSKTKRPKRNIPFSHLHVHSEFSILQSTASVKKLLARAREYKMQAIAITDLGNLHAAFKATAGQGDDLKVIVGCELYVAKERKRLKFTRDEKDEVFQQVLLAKNQEGYHNLCKISSYGYIEGYYSGKPRVGKDLIEQYNKHLIALTGNIYGEIPKLILEKGEIEAEEAFKWWLDLFGDDFYVELIRHGLPEEDRVNEVLLGFAEKYGVKVIATNDVYFIDKKEKAAHDVLLCVKDGATISDEANHDSYKKYRRQRYALPNDEYYLKTQEEMNELFYDIPAALENVQEIIDKCSPVKLKRDILLPRFPLPEGFENEDDYLKHISFEGAKTRYETPLSDEVVDRLNHELKIIKNMGFPGYFLIVQDFINAAKDMGVSVGPGRGSAAGSAVAFCIGITNIDPIKYDLLFERFLNPERVSMPDIDIDFDDERRGDAINYVIEKYGKNQVAQIITYGTMAAKMSIKDVGRALELPLAEANGLAKLVPDSPGTTLKKAFDEVSELVDISKKNDLQGETMRLAQICEGSVRNTGIHAAGVIIAPDDLLEYIPVCTSKDADLFVTQFDGKVIEDAGMLKMDFLGLKTLTIIKGGVDRVKQNHGIELDMDEIPLDDPKTLELYQKGETVGTFQFESVGMQKYLKELKPTNIEDLIAMNALYRPGPLQFIPNFINRKHGREEVEYPHELLEPILKNTYGIMVYQEQIMQAAQILGGYSLGGADLLRRAMGKKKIEEMERQRGIFVEGAAKHHGISQKKAEQVFAIMEKFAAYGFNRSHSAAYSVVAYQTAYLKANYPAEYMASVMSNSMGSIDKITFFLEECKRMGLKVLGPDVNESRKFFDVNDKGEIRFGLGAIKGTGDAAVEAIIEEREENGKYVDIWDFVERIDLRKANKKTMESLAYAGAFDSFEELHRAQYFHILPGEQSSGIEKIIKFGAHTQMEKQSAQVSLFGAASGVEMPKPKIPECEEWPNLEKLKFEKEVVGFYLTGHPLDPFKLEIEAFCTPYNKIEYHQNKEIKVGGIVSEVVVRQSKSGNEFALFSIEDFDGTLRLAAFGEVFMKYRHLLVVGSSLYIKGKVKERYNQPGNWELSPQFISLLSEAKDEISKVKITLDVSDLTDEAVSTVSQLVEENTGSCELKMKVVDKTKNIQLDMLSRKYRVNPTSEFVEKIKQIPGLRVGIA